jgi:hypothetical protein
MDLYEKIKRNKHNVTPGQLIELLESLGLSISQPKAITSTIKDPVSDVFLYRFARTPWPSISSRQLCA